MEIDSTELTFRLVSLVLLSGEVAEESGLLLFWGASVGLLLISIASNTSGTFIYTRLGFLT